MPIFSTEHTQALMMIAGMGLLCWMLMRSKMRKASKGQTTTKEIAPGGTAIGSLKYNSQAKVKPGQYSGVGSLSAPGDALQWQLDLHDLGRELKAELDCKLLAVREMTFAYERASRRLLALIHAAERTLPAESGLLDFIRTHKVGGLSDCQIANELGLSETDVAELSMLLDGSQSTSSQLN